MAARPSALLLSPEAPYPMWGGGALRTASLLHYLAARYDVDILLFHEPQAGDPAAALPPGMVRRAGLVELPFHSRSAGARIRRNSRRLLLGVPPLIDRFSGFEDRIRWFTHGQDYDLAVVEHFWCAPYHKELASRARRLVLDLHNIESDWHFRLAREASPMMAAAHRRFGAAYERLEREWLPRFDLVLAPSAEDAERAGARVYPNTIPDPGNIIRDEAPRLVFAGNMEYEPNLQAVAWFGREVWPRVLAAHPGLEWRLVGKNEARVRALARSWPRVTVTGPVESAFAELARAMVVVAPLRSGSGTRLKIIEAWAAGAPVVSTTIGAEGLGAGDGVHLLLADSAADFAAAIGRFMDSAALRRMAGEEGRQRFKECFTWEAGWKQLLALGI